MEDVLKAQPEEVDIQEQITREAARLEAEQIGTYIREWIERRVKGVFQRAVVTVRHDEAMAWYEVKVEYRQPQGKIYGSVRTIRDEEIAAQATQTSRWTRFLDREAEAIKLSLRKALIADGVVRVEMDRPGLSQSLTGLSSSFMTSMNQFGIDARQASEAADEVASANEVREAIESIKRTAEGRETEQ